MIRVAVSTFTRAEYGSLSTVLEALRERGDVMVQLIVSGTHLSPWHGQTIEQIVADGHQITERIEMQLASDQPEGVVQSVALATAGFGHALSRLRPDILLLAGDRTELLAPATAALVSRIPVAHISGGDVTEGAVDDQVRNAVSKLSHLHFAAMPAHGIRLQQMGEEEWRIHVTGDPALDALGRLKLLSRKALEESLGLQFRGPLLAVTYHPATLGLNHPADEADELAAALQDFGGTLVISAPNADVGSNSVLTRLRQLVAQHPSAVLVANLGQQRYYSLLRQADAMVGNSSSGIWEAPSFALPVVNIGDRQGGRLRAPNVIDVPAARDAIRTAMAQALNRSFRDSLKGIVNPYGDGQAAVRIARVLVEEGRNPRLLHKKFIDR
jgi:GDP/UDP-N,N'-diacetylbacillosamine 2-epimerase (hydrolysing)